MYKGREEGLGREGEGRRGGKGEGRRREEGEGERWGEGGRWGEVDGERLVSGKEGGNVRERIKRTSSFL